MNIQVRLDLAIVLEIQIHLKFNLDFKFNIQINANPLILTNLHLYLALLNQTNNRTPQNNVVHKTLNKPYKIDI